MSLRWNVGDVKDYETLHEDDAQWVITEALIWATMPLGMNRITQKNWAEFYARLSMWQGLYGNNLVFLNMEPYRITADDVKRRIGLGTNASTLPRTTFMKNMVNFVNDNFGDREKV